MKKFDTIVFIGRMQPIHNAHARILQQAAKLADYVLVLIGSAARPATFDNPFSYHERMTMVREITDDYPAHFFFEPLRDFKYDDVAWLKQIQDLVEPWSRDGGKMGIIGHEKDESSYYLKCFPQWEFIEADVGHSLSATNIRELYFKEKPNMSFLQGVLDKRTIARLEAFQLTDKFAQLVREKQFIEKYKSQYASLPYPPIFVTTDAVVVQSGHVLLVKRRAEPGKGLWAFPGGFVDAVGDQSVEDAMVRELYEETSIKLPEKVIRGSIEEVKVFDSPNRSKRGRTITHAFHVHLKDGEWNLPMVKGSDDAERAEWAPLTRVSSETMFEDHYDILQYFIGSIQ